MFFILFFLCFLFLLLMHIYYNNYEVNEKGAILITGCSSGLGKHMSLLLNNLGYTVYATVRNDKDKTNLKDICPKLRVLKLDVRDKKQCEKIINQIEQELINDNLNLIGLINNAGISRRMPFELENINDIKNLYEVNVFGVLNITKPAIRLLRKKKGSRIINIGSVAGFAPDYAAIGYAGSKAALKIITDIMRIELYPWKIAVSLIQPAYINTKISSKLYNNVIDYNSNSVNLKHYHNWFKNFIKVRKKQESLASNVNIISNVIRHVFQSNFPNNNYIISNSGLLPAKLIFYINNFFPDFLLNIIFKIYNRAYLHK